MAVSVAAHERELEAVRERSFGVAYRMLGSVAEAEDVAQEAMLRLARTEKEIEEPLAWITTVATRVSIDLLRLARRRRESYVGPWLPEPLIDGETVDVGGRAEMADSLSQAFLVVLERLNPVERAAFLLREIFEYDYPHIAAVIDRSEVNTRQLVARAKKHLDAIGPASTPMKPCATGCSSVSYRNSGPSLGERRGGQKWLMGLFRPFQRSSRPGDDRSRRAKRQRRAPSRAAPAQQA
jgi:RNA polymerase sigma factor (sigma-70 family)